MSTVKLCVENKHLTHKEDTFVLFTSCTIQACKQSVSQCAWEIVLHDDELHCSPHGM